MTNHCPEGHERVLARSPCAEAIRCRCGHVRLTVGPVTLRLDEVSFRALCLTLLDAIEELQKGDLDERARQTATARA